MDKSHFYIEPSLQEFLEDRERVAKVVKGFGAFLKNRWNAELPTQQAFSLCPLICSKEFLIKDWTPKLLKAIDTVRRVVLANLSDSFEPTLTQLVGNFPINRERLKWELSRPGGAVFARPDVVVNSDGTSRILELNLGPGFAGMFWCEQLLGLYRSEPLLNSLFQKAKISFSSPYLDFSKFLDQRESKTVAVLETGLPYMFSQATTEYLNRYRKNGRTLSVGHYELEPQERNLEVDRCQIDTIYPNVLPHYFNEQFLAPIWKSEVQGQVKILGQHLDAILGAKSSLVLCYQLAQRNKLSANEKSLIESWVPPGILAANGKAFWKGNEIDTKSFCLSNQKNLVLKRAVGEQANGLTIGNAVSASNWLDKIEAAFTDEKNRWIVQEYVPHPIVQNYYWDRGEEKVKLIEAGFHVCAFVFGNLTSLGIRMGTSKDQKAPLVGPDDGSCSINLIGLSEKGIYLE